MPYMSIIVHDVSELEKFRNCMNEKKRDIETLYEGLGSACRDQSRNWQDGQYREFEKQLEKYTSAATRQLEDLQEAIDMVTAVLNRLQ